MVTFVSSLIHIYSVGFMREDEDYVRFFCYMNLFVFAMLVVTLSDNLLFLYLGWEGVGFCSYALIGFWYADEVKATAGRKAFILTRIGDVAFGIAIAFFFIITNTLSLSSINGQAASLSAGMATTLGILLLFAAAGKSAQLPLAVWLPDAMAGPTPVSALIHAATMVTAGVYLLIRFFPVVSLSPAALLIIAIVGAGTALFAACAALAQKDIKRILAYSTISQVSYMFLGVGAGDITGGMFHLLSHAFFKALLFLAAGCVIHVLHEEHDIFRMGSLRSRLPAVFWLFLAGSLALGAIPPFGGFFSKDRILLATFIHPEPIYKILWVVAAVTALLTPLYTFRLFFIVFLERPDALRDSSRKEPGLRPLPQLMVWTLWPLAILSLIAGLLNIPLVLSGNEWLASFLSPPARQRSVAGRLLDHRRRHGDRDGPAFHHCTGTVLLPLSTPKIPGYPNAWSFTPNSGAALFLRILLRPAVSSRHRASLPKDLQVSYGRESMKGGWTGDSIQRETSFPFSQPGYTCGRRENSPRT